MRSRTLFISYDGTIYTRLFRDNHEKYLHSMGIHRLSYFVDGTDGGFTMAAKLLKDFRSIIDIISVDDKIY